VGKNDAFSLIRQFLLAKLGRESEVFAKDWLIVLSVAWWQYWTARVAHNGGETVKPLRLESGWQSCRVR